MLPRIILLVLLVIALTIGSLSMIQEPATLECRGWFDLQDRIPPPYLGSDLRVDRFLARPNGLYFLVAQAPGGLRFILHTDFDGTFRKAIAVLADTYSFDADAGGNILVLQGRMLHVFDSDGKAAGPARLADAQEVCATDGRTLTISSDGAVSEMQEQGRKTLLSLPPGLRKMLVAGAPGRRLIVLDGIAARLHLVDASAQMTRAVDIESALVRDARAAYVGTYKGGPHAAPVVTHALAIAPDGRIYVSVSGLSVAAGAPVLELDREGAVTRVLRCALPPGRREGSPWMPPSYIAAAGDRLFIADGFGRVAFYNR